VHGSGSCCVDCRLPQAPLTSLPFLWQAIAAILSNQLEGETKLEDECAWYGLSYLIDTTLGLVLAIMCLRIQDYLADKYNIDSIKNNGVYTGPEACKHWTAQTTCWMIILTVVKIIIYYFMVIFSDMLAFFGSILFAPLQINIRFELLFVMIFFPGFLNVIYFWIADSYLKADHAHEGAFEAPKDKEISLISKEEKEAQARADSDMAAMSERSQQQQRAAAAAEQADHSDWKQHTEFIATYLPSWSVFGSQQTLDGLETTATTANNNNGSMA
jgi:STIMATE family